MASKRKQSEKGATSKGKGKQTASFDSFRFVSSEAQKRYDDACKNPRKAVPERGLDFGDDEHHSVNIVIRSLGWERFVLEPRVAILPLVREFYANVVEHTDGVVRVRGVEVAFHDKVINSFYGLPDIESGEYEAYRSEADTETVLRSLTSGPVEWQYSKGLPSTFVGQFLTDVSRIWQYFVCSRLLPTFHHSDITRDRAVLMYAIMQQMTMNVGRMIYERIMYSAKNTTVSYFFPQLITGLCLQAGVQYGEEEERLPPAPRLTKQYMAKLTSGKKGQSSRGRVTGRAAQTTKGQLTNLAIDVQTLQEQNRCLARHMSGIEQLVRLHLSHVGVDSSHIDIPPFSDDLMGGPSVDEEEDSEGDLGDDMEP